MIKIEMTFLLKPNPAVHPPKKKRTKEERIKRKEEMLYCFQFTWKIQIHKKNANISRKITWFYVAIYIRRQ